MSPCRNLVRKVAGMFMDSGVICWTCTRRTISSLSSSWTRSSYSSNSSNSAVGGSFPAHFPISSPPWSRILVRNKKNLMARFVLDVDDPMAEKSGRDKDKEKRVTVDSRPNKSASNFNLTMGEIMMGKSHSRIALEGGRMVEEAVKSGLKLEKIFLLKSLKTLPEGLEYLLEEEKEQLLSGVRAPEIHRIGLKSMETWSSLTTPPGIIGIFKKPQPDDYKLYLARPRGGAVGILPLTVIADNVREPGNLGSILRTASGAGCDDVWLTKGCVDPWNIKVLRGGSGAHFRLTITTDTTSTEELLERLMEKKMLKIMGNKLNSEKEDQFSVLVCDSNLDDGRLPLFPSIPFRNVDYTKFSHSFLIIGGETTGISDKTVKTLKLLNKKSCVNLFRIRIPLANSMESLNAANAFGIIVFEIVRQLSLDF